MPIIYGVICGTGLMGAALIILMTGQMFGAHPMASGPISSVSEASVVTRSTVPNANLGNTQRTKAATDLGFQRLSRAPI